MKIDNNKLRCLDLKKFSKKISKFRGCFGTKYYQIVQPMPTNQQKINDNSNGSEDADTLILDVDEDTLNYLEERQVMDIDSVPDDNENNKKRRRSDSVDRSENKRQKTGDLTVSQPAILQGQRHVEKITSVSQPKMFDQQKPLMRDMQHTCCYFLIEKCPRESQHKILDANELRMLLNEGEQEEAIHLFNDCCLVFKDHFKGYFRVFCEYFAEKRMKKQLLQLAKICTDPTYNKPSQLVHIVNGLVKIGYAYSVAVYFVLNPLRRTPVSPYWLIYLITDPRNNNLQLFEKEIISILTFLKFKLNSFMIERFLIICNKSKCSVHLRFIGKKLINTASTSDINTYRKIDIKLIQEFFASKLNISF